MSRLDKVKQLVADQRVSGEVQETYNKRLTEGQAFFNSLNEQTDKVLATLRAELEEETRGDNIPELVLKRDVIAKYRVLEKIPFYSERLDVMPTATTNTVLRQLVNDHINATRQLKRYEDTVSQQADIVLAMHSDYAYFNSSINDEAIEKKKQELKRYQDQISSQLEVPVEDIDAALNKVVKSSDRTVTELNNFLKKVLIKYLSFDSFNLDKAELNSNLAVLMKLFKTLMNNLATGNEYMTLQLTAIEVSLVQNLAMNEIIMIKLAKNNEFQIRLRDYSN